MIEKATLFFASWELFREAALSGAIAGFMLGLLGVYVVLRRMVFLSAALSQTAGLGVATAFLLAAWGTPAWIASPTLGAVAASLLTVYLLTRGNDRHVSRDSLLGAAFLLGSAGTIVIGSRIPQELHDVQTLLLGSAVAVSPEGFRLIVVTGIATVIWHAWWWRGFAAVTVDRDDAAVRGLPTRGLAILLLVSIAVAVSVTTRVLGALPAFAFSVIPAVAALRLAPNIPGALTIAAIIGAVGGFGGYFLAYLLDFPVGASQTILCVAMLAVVFAVKR